MLFILSPFAIVSLLFDVVMLFDNLQHINTLMAEDQTGTIALSIICAVIIVITGIHLLNLLCCLGILKNMEGIKLNIVTLVNILSYVSVPIAFIIFIFVAWCLFR